MKRICSVSVKTSNPRNIPRRLLSLALCGLLLLSAGCQAGVQPTDPPKPKPSTLFLDVDLGTFTVTNGEGQTLSYDGAFSGTMEILEEFGVSKDYTESELQVLRISYSPRFVYEREEAPEGDAPWHISLGGFQEGSFYRPLFAVRGGGPYGGGAERVEYDEDAGTLLIQGEPRGGLVELTLSLPDSSTLDQSTGTSGWFTLTAMIGGTGEIRLARKGDLVTFSGLEPGAATLKCGPDAGFHILPLNLERGSGTLNFSDAGQGQGKLLLQEEGLASQTLPTPVPSSS